MARLLLIALTVGIVVCNPPKQLKISYAEGHEYVYDYETQILTGLPEGSQVYSGIKLVTTVHFQMDSIFNFNMEFRNPRVYKINSLLDTYDPTQEMVPTKAFTELLDEDAVNMKNGLVIPVTFSYMRGQVENVMTSGNDPEWSVNIKKGCLSLMEMNFNERHSLTPKVDVKGPEPFQTIYSVFEPSLTGECETTYRIMMNTNAEGTKNMQMEKVRNFENCMERIMFTEDMLSGRPCQFCHADSTINTFTAQSMVRYEMLGTPDDFMIVSAVAESMYTFVPMTEGRGIIMTFANQTMTLVDQVFPIAMESKIPEPASPQAHRRPLRAVKYARDDKLRTEQLILQQGERHELVLKATKILTGISRINENQVEMTSDELIKELWWILREMDKQGLTLLMEEVMKKSSIPITAKKTFVDILPTVGTFESVDVLLNWMEHNTIEPETALATYIFMALMPEPHYLTVERFIAHVKNFHMEPTDGNLWRTAWLTLGSFGFKVNKMRTTLVKDMEDEMAVLTLMMKENNVKQTRMAIETRIEELTNKIQQTIKLHNAVEEEIITMVQTLFENKNKAYRVLALKVMNNLGSEHFLPQLEELALNKNEELLVRQAAVDSMMRYITQGQYLERVRRILLPIYFDYTEPDDLRINAFFVTIFAGPSKSELEMIAKSLYNEPSTNVGSFVWDTLIAFSNTTTTCNCVASLAHNTTLALRFAKRPEENFRYSSLWVFNYFNDVHRQGISSTNGIVFSPNERFPTTISSFMETTIFGRTFSTLGLQFRGQGLDTLYESLLDTPHMSPLQKMMSPRFRRSVTENEEDIKDIKDKLEVEPSEQVVPEGTLEVHLLGQNVFYFDIESVLELNADELKKESQKSKTKILQQKVLKAIPKMRNAVAVVNRFFNSERSFFFPTVHSWMPTEAGLPLHLTFNLIGSFRMNGEMSMQPANEKPLNGPSSSMMNMIFNFRPSGFFETNADMMVDMRFYRSGITTNMRNYMNTPVAMTVGGDMSRAKFFMRITNMTAEMPFVHEAFSQTFVQRMPYHASRFPQPLDKQEITVTADANIDVYSYEVGQDFFGLTYTMEGQWTSPKSPNVAQFPLCGKRTMYIKFDPLHSNELDIHFQHTRAFARDQSKEDKDKSWLSDTLSWFFSPEKDQPEMPIDPVNHESKQPESPERPPLAPVKPFINLREEDLSISYLERWFRKDTDFMRSGLKCGMAITITRPGENPEYKVQLLSLYQMDATALNHWYTVDLSHFTPQTPENPWRMVTSTKMSMPSTVLEPSSLQNNEYQRQVQEQINMALEQDATDFSAAFDIQYYIMISAMNKMLVSAKRDNAWGDVQELINHVLEHSVSADLDKLEAVVQDQRQIEIWSRDLQDGPIDLQRVTEMLQDLEMIQEKAEQVPVMIEEYLIDQQQPQTSVMVNYLIISQTRTLSGLDAVLHKLEEVAPEPKYLALKSRMESLREKLIQVTKRQLIISEKNQALEARRARIEVEPSEMNIYQQLIELEKKLITVLLNHFESKVHTPPIQFAQELTVIADLSEQVTKELNKHLMPALRINQVVRVKMADVLLQMRQIVWIVDNMIEQINTEVSQVRQVPSITPQEPQHIQQMKRLLEIKDQLVGQVEAFAKRILLAVNVETEWKYLASVLTANMERDMKSLDSITVRQLGLFEALNMPPADRLAGKWLQHIVEEITQAHTELYSIVERDIFTPSPSSIISPVLIKAASSLADQLEIIDVVRILLEENLQLEAVNDRNMVSLRTMYSNVMSLTEETWRTSDRILRQVESSPYEPNPENRKLSAASLVKHAMKIDAQHLRLKTKASKLYKQLLESPAMNAYPVSQKLPNLQMNLNELLFEFVQAIQNMQVEASALYREIIQTLSEGSDPEYRYLEEMLISLEKRLEQLLKVVHTVETPLKERASRDSALMKPLETLQQVKDELQRTIHENQQVKVTAISSSKNQKSSKDSLKQAYKSPHAPRRSLSGQQGSVPSQPRDMMSAIRGEATITFGPIGQTQKTIIFKFLGRKTLEQLLWERDQILPSKQDQVVKNYLEDKEMPDDRTALYYRQIKSELNSYRHMHFFCTYEETIPFTLKNYMFQFHQIIKYYIYDQAVMSLPTAETHLSNEFEFIMDFDRDDQWMSMRIDTANEITRVDFLEVPSWFRMTFIPITYSMNENLISSYVGDVTETCYISPRRITTFDRRRLMPELEHRPCESVLAVDCSPNHEYVVTKEPGSNGQQPRVSIITKHYRFIITQDASNKIVVESDGKRIPLDKSPVVIEKEGIPVHVIAVSGDEILLMVPHIGLYVASDGDRAVVKLSQNHQGKVCGLCGNMDGKWSNDWTGPHKVSYPESKSLASTYLIPSDQCDVKTIQKELKVPEIRKQTGRIQPLMHTAVLKRKQDQISLICFSTTPIRTCPPNSLPVEEKTRYAGYHCLKAGRQARKLKNEASMRILHEMKATSSDYSSSVTEPGYCRKV